MLRCCSRPIWIGLPLGALVCIFAGLTLLPAYSRAPAPMGPPKTVTVDLGGEVKMVFVLIPKGKFQMGSPKDEAYRNPYEDHFDAEKQHEVEITKPFYLAKYPVTQEQYLAITGTNPSQFSKDALQPTL